MHDYLSSLQFLHGSLTMDRIRNLGFLPPASALNHELAVMQSTEFSSIPDGPLLQIIRLSFRTARQRFIGRAVCSRWRTLLSSPEEWVEISIWDTPKMKHSDVIRLLQHTSTRPPPPPPSPSLQDPNHFVFLVRHLDISGAWGVDLSSLLPALHDCPFLTRLTACKGAFGRPLVDSACLKALASWIPMNSHFHAKIDVELQDPQHIDLLCSVIGGGVRHLTIRACHLGLWLNRDIRQTFLQSLQDNSSLEEIHLCCLTPFLNDQWDDFLLEMAVSMCGNTTLHTLRFQAARFVCHETLHHPFTQLFSSLTNLSHLEIVRCGLTGDVIHGISKSAMQSHSLQSLCLDRMWLGAHAGMLRSVFPSIPSMHSLRSLRLQSIEGFQLSDVGDAIRHAHGLMDVDLRGNVMNVEGMKVLFPALAENVSLISLRLEDGRWDSEKKWTSQDQILIVDAFQSMVKSIRSRGGIHTLGLSLPPGIYPFPQHAWMPRQQYQKPSRQKYLSIFKELVSSPSNLVSCLYLTCHKKQWSLRDELRFCIHFSLLKSINIPNRIRNRIEEINERGVVLKVDMGSSGSDTWHTHTCIPGEPPRKKRISFFLATHQNLLLLFLLGLLDPIMEFFGEFKRLLGVILWLKLQPVLLLCALIYGFPTIHEFSSYFQDLGRLVVEIPWRLLWPLRFLVRNAHGFLKQSLQVLHFRESIWRGMNWRFAYQRIQS